MSSRKVKKRRTQVNVIKKVMPYEFFTASLYAKRRSGKTYLIWKLLKALTKKHSEVHIFAPTVNLDKTWGEITNWLDSKGINYTTYTDLNDDDGNDIISGLLDEWAIPAEPEEEESSEEDEDELEKPWRGFRPNELESFSQYNETLKLQKTKKKTKKKKKKKPPPPPDRWVIIDDNSEHLKRRSIHKLFYNGRHYRAKVLTSCHDIKKQSPDMIANSVYSFLFKRLPEERIKHIKDKLDLDVADSKFTDMYALASKRDYGFLLIDSDRDKYYSSFKSELK